MPDDDPYLDDLTPLHPANAVVAILLTPDLQYILQLRDRKRGIFFPGHWGCFGGAVEPEDATPEATLARELHEELNVDLSAAVVSYFTNYTFDLSFCGIGQLYRTYYEVRLRGSAIQNLKLGEGSAFRSFGLRDLLSRQDVVPYDTFALWLHGSRKRLRPA